MSYWVETFLRDAIVMISLKSGFQTLPCRFVSFHNTSILACVGECLHSLEFPAAPWKTFSCLHLAGDNHWQRSFEFLSCVFNGFFMLFVFRIDEVDTSRFSSIVELWLLNSPFLLLLLFGGFRHANSRSQATNNLVGLLLGSSSGTSRTTYILEEVAHLITWTSWILPTYLTKFDPHQNSNYRCVWVLLVTSIYFSGIGNDSSFGTLSRTRSSTWWRQMKVSFNRLEVIAGFSVLFCFCWLRPTRASLKFFAEIFTPNRIIPPQSWFSDFIISPKQFFRAVCDWEYEKFTFFSRYFLCIWAFPS